MIGRLKSDQGQLFYEFHLDDAVPEDHLMRKIYYSSMGRPSVDPELMIRMLVVGTPKPATAAERSARSESARKTIRSSDRFADTQRAERRWPRLPSKPSQSYSRKGLLPLLSR
jgi:phosphatidate phosphatase PAH1